MTQAFNLGQLANNLNTSGQLDATDGLVGAVPIANGGTGATSASTARTNLDVAASAYAVPAGGIIIWSGSQASIPTGWLLCNGTSSTPDLRDRFIVGAGSTYAVAASGGSANAILVSHTHTFTGTAHSHTFSNQNFSTGTVAGGSSPPTMMDPATGTTSSVTAGGTNSTEGSSGTNANLPPYYALCYIMKS
jgi:microcystin-dependent protein